MSASGGATRLKLLEGALRTLVEQGIAKTSARSIATTAGVNQALIFYHFGSVDALLAAACVHGAEQRVSRYRERLAALDSLTELLTFARAMHAEERAAGQVAVLGHLLAAGQTAPALAAATSAGLALWIEELEAVLTRLLATTPWPPSPTPPGWPVLRPPPSSASNCTRASTPRAPPAPWTRSNSSPSSLRPWKDSAPCPNGQSPTGCAAAPETDLASPRSAHAVQPLVNATPATADRFVPRSPGFAPHHIPAFLEQDWHERFIRPANIPSMNDLSAARPSNSSAGPPTAAPAKRPSSWAFPRTKFPGASTTTASGSAPRTPPQTSALP